MSHSSESSSEFMRVLLAQAYEERREAARRAATHVRVYVSVAAALVAVMAAVVTRENTEFGSACGPVSLALLALGVVGGMTFARFIAIQQQVAMHTINISRYCHYFLDRDSELPAYFASSKPLWSSCEWGSYSPFSSQVASLLRVFACFNAVVIVVGIACGVASLGGADTPRYFLSQPLLAVLLLLLLLVVGWGQLNLLRERLESAKTAVNSRIRGRESRDGVRAD